MRQKLKKLANGFADRGAARLACHQKGDATSFQMRGKSLHLGRFPASLRPFKRDEWQPRHYIDCEIKRDACRTMSVAQPSWLWGRRVSRLPKSETTGETLTVLT